MGNHRESWKGILRGYPASCGAILGFKHAGCFASASMAFDLIYWQENEGRRMALKYSPAFILLPIFRTTDARWGGEGSGRNGARGSGRKGLRAQARVRTLSGPPRGEEEPARVPEDGKRVKEAFGD